MREESEVLALFLLRLFSEFSIACRNPTVVNAQQEMADDPFDDLFGLEDRYYDHGYQQGLRDGLQQSQLEARLFGLEKGFVKFVEMGEMQAKARYWKGLAEEMDRSSATTRILKHVEVLMTLVDPQTLSVENDDEAVSSFDDRLKRAQAKCKIIRRLLDEPDEGKAFDPPLQEHSNNPNMSKPPTKDVEF